MGIHARIEPGGYVTIDTLAWPEQRTGGPDPDLTDDRYKVAVVGINHDAPTVYAETPHLDPWDWLDADSIDIHCPGGHGWTWRTGRELVTADDCTFTTLTVVFGPNLDAPFTPCPTCTAHHLGQRTTPSGCDRTPWIVCPTCGHRCDVELPSH